MVVGFVGLKLNQLDHRDMILCCLIVMMIVTSHGGLESRSIKLKSLATRAIKHDDRRRCRAVHRPVDTTTQTRPVATPATEPVTPTAIA